MALDKKTFQLAKNPSPLILDFLEKNPEKAYTMEEIIENIPILRDLGFAKKTPSFSLSNPIRDALINLTGAGKIESVLVKGDIYYILKEEKEDAF